MNSENSTPSSVSRRSLLKAAGWAAPAIVLTTAAPAAAASTSPVTPDWGITSNSWRGDIAGWRNDVAFYIMNFTITVPEGSTMNGAVVTVQFDRNDLGTQIRGNLAGNVAGWTTTREEYFGGQYARFVFDTIDVLPTASGQNVKTLSFNIDSIGYLGPQRLGTITFESPGLPTKVWRLMRENDVPVGTKDEGQVAFPM